MFSTDPEHRNEYTDGLRQLADYLDAHPGVPVPEFGTQITVYLRHAEDGGITDIAAMSVELAAPFVEDDGTYLTSRVFGPVTYEGYSTTAAHLKRFSAHHSYYGCVTPDD